MSTVIVYGRNFFSREEEEFLPVLAAAEAAIADGVFPDRIPAGSSGSYFVLDKARKRIAVFKPKNEEPFAHLNPKWPKFFQRTMSPCCFGRSCLLQNQGYLSEAGASLVDELLGLNLVPKTKVVGLASPTFHYAKKYEHPPRKIGSFQIFFNGGDDAGPVLHSLGYGSSQKAGDAELRWASEEVREAFHQDVQRMIALDFIIRNTDRSGENWLIKLSKEGELVSGASIAVIDNGLSFPWKHPEDWRNYPFYWANLAPFADEPFRPNIAEQLMPKLRSPVFLEAVASHLRDLFKMDGGFRSDFFERQMNVLRGQIWALTEALEEGKTPRQLAAGTPLVVVRRWRQRNNTTQSITESAELGDLYKVRAVDARPCFRNF